MRGKKMIIDDIKKANVQAMRDRNTTARNIYGVVINKLMLEIIKRRDGGTLMTEADEVQIINKTIKELVEEQEGYRTAGRVEQVEEIARQIDIISVYMPELLSEEKITMIIEGLSDRSVPSVMRHFKENHAGKCDMKTVSNVLKNIK
ncbi:MAG: hypothetical protein EOM87_02855 [Clostridia bacterium]|nr:hypothetical protein [Clostridia bacterium]